jgi:hypothetical protein
LEIAPALTGSHRFVPSRSTAYRDALNWRRAPELVGSREPRRISMTDHKKKGDFDHSRKHDTGGNRKSHMKGASRSRTGSKQNAGHGGHH